MRRFICLIVALLIGIPIAILAATNATEMRASATIVTKGIPSTASYSKVCSVSITQDTVGNTLLFAGGELWLKSNEQINLAIGTDTTSGGVPQMVVATIADTTVCDLHKYPCYFGDRGQSSYVIPFSIVQHLDTDSVDGAIVLYLWARSGDAYRADLTTNASIVPTVKNVYLHAIVNLTDQP